MADAKRVLVGGRESSKIYEPRLGAALWIDRDIATCIHVTESRGMIESSV